MVGVSNLHYIRAARKTDMATLQLHFTVQSSARAWVSINQAEEPACIPWAAMNPTPLGLRGRWVNYLLTPLMYVAVLPSLSCLKKTWFSVLWKKSYLRSLREMAFGGIFLILFQIPVPKWMKKEKQCLLRWAPYTWEQSHSQIAGSSGDHVCEWMCV